MHNLSSAVLPIEISITGDIAALVHTEGFGDLVLFKTAYRVGVVAMGAATNISCIETRPPSISTVVLFTSGGRVEK
jgi:hypothetical protein